LKNKYRGPGLPRASVLIALAMLAFTAPLHAAGGLSANATKTTKQALWVADYYVFSELEGAHLRFAFGISNDSPGGLTFDSSGNFWGTFCTGGTDGLGLVFELTQRQLRKLKSGGSAKPQVQFQNPYPLFDCPGALAFDNTGNLWVANSGPNSSIMKYAADQLTTGGTLVPAAVLTFNTADFGRVADIEFDSAGNLWLVNSLGVAGVFELTLDQISVTGTNQVAPNLQLTSEAIVPMSALTFDGGGNLWVGGLTSGPLQLFAASDLSGSGMISPTPLATIEPVTVKHRYSSFSQTGGLAIDDQGSLWVSSLLGDGEKLRGNISEFTAAQISASGSPQPSLFLKSGTLTQHPALMAFGPLL
jgi:sugar lactone lactonase YvrE